MAFHLGCLRALDRLGLLRRIDVLSTVSGGSVIGAFFHAHDGDFASFESKMREILSQGLARRMCRKLLSPLGLKVAAAFALIGAVAVVVALIRTMVALRIVVRPTAEDRARSSALQRISALAARIWALLSDFPVKLFISYGIFHSI